MVTVAKGNNCKLWEDCLNYISLRTKKSSFHTWFKHSRGNKEENGELTIIVPNQFVADWLAAHYSELISDALKEVNGSSVDYQFAVSDAKDNIPQTEINFHPAQARTERVPDRNALLNERYRFDNFVVGGFNQFAHAAAQAVAEAKRLSLL